MAMFVPGHQVVKIVSEVHSSFEEHAQEVIERSFFVLWVRRNVLVVVVRHAAIIRVPRYVDVLCVSAGLQPFEWHVCLDGSWLLHSFGRLSTEQFKERRSQHELSVVSGWDTLVDDAVYDVLHPCRPALRVCGHKYVIGFWSVGQR
ncbi:hypothetical protein ISCGN_028514 [Ixodes scapularis]